MQSAVDIYVIFQYCSVRTSALFLYRHEMLGEQITFLTVIDSCGVICLCTSLRP